MRYRGLLIVAAVAIVNVAVAAGTWLAMSSPLAPVAAPVAPPGPAPRDAAPEMAPSLAVQRLAEFVSGAAFRALITNDYAGLHELVKRAAAWPEVTYLSVEDTQGRVVAHTDPARIGQPGAPSGQAASPRPGLQEVTVALAGPEVAGKPRALAGQVRLGYLGEEPRGAAAPAAPAPAAPPAPPDARFPLAALLVGAALAAIPIGFGLARLAGTASAGPEPLAADLRKISNLRQARITIAHWMREAEGARGALALQRAEAERLTHELAERTAELSRSESVREAIDREAATWAGERERLNAEVRARTLESEDARMVLQARTAELEDASRARLLLEAEMADLRDEVQAARGALAGHPTGARDLVDQELKQHQHRVIAYISRTIRGSLTSILGFSRLLLRAGDGPLNEAQRASAINIHEAGNRLLRVVNDLSDLTQVEAGTVELRDEIVDVAAVFREVAATAASALGRDPETIAVESPGELPAVRGNKRRLVQLLLSLMHSPTLDGDGSTELAARADEDSLSLTVTHRGAAIPCQEVATLFDPFSPIEATEMLQDDGRRLRLGLARALATTIGGHLTVETLEDTGTVFTVTVPVVADVSAVA